MPEQVTIFRRSEKTVGRPPIKRVTIERSTSDAIPEGAVSLEGLREAEIARAAKARHSQTESGAYGVFVLESACVAQTDVGSLTRSLGPEAIAYELVAEPDQPSTIEANPGQI